VEFGLVLRKDLGEGQEVTDKTIGDVVAGVVLCNDVSARDTMFGATFMQWYRGKSYRTFCPTGPALWLLEPGEVRDALQNLEIKLWVMASYANLQTPSNSFGSRPSRSRISPRPSTCAAVISS
jgi:2-keto-4-pentenoate hydratase/2-oxohepta-3-ene-1,7-dioic acid hydratase in catechol pathway